MKNKTVYIVAVFIISLELGARMAAAAVRQPRLKWELSEQAVLSNGILTVDVPLGAKPELYGATAYVGFEPFEGRSLGAKVMASGENVAVPANSCHGLKLMLHFTSPETGDDC